MIVLWTKTDSLDLAKIKQLMKEGKSKSEAMEQAPQEAWADFEKNTYQHFDKFMYPPKAFCQGTNNQSNIMVHLASVTVTLYST